MINIVCVCRLGQDYPASSYVSLCMCVVGEGGGAGEGCFYAYDTHYKRELYPGCSGYELILNSTAVGIAVGTRQIHF